jgi:small-conductance mechanosensitive channel
MSFLGNVFGGIGSGISDIVGGLTGANKAAKATQQMGARVEQETARAVSMAQPTANELDLLSQGLVQQQQQINFTNSQLASLGDLLAQISPILAEGYNQQLASMRGQNVGPISRQIDIERQQNLNRQGASMGVGASGSSAGMMADALFGQQAGMARLQEQQGLSQMNAQNAQVANALMGTGGNLFQSGAATRGSLFEAINTGVTRGVNAQLGLASVSGSENLGRLYQGQSMQSMVNTALGAAAGAVAGKKVG